MLRAPLASMVALAVMAASATTEAAPNPRRCDDAYGTTIRANRAIRVFFDDNDAQLFACRRPSGKPRYLGDEYTREGSSTGSSVVHLRLTSRFVAFGVECEEGGNGQTAEVTVVDVDSRRTVTPVNLGGAPCVVSGQSDFGIEDVELTGRGSITWIAVEYGFAAGRRVNRYSVGRYDRFGAALLDVSEASITGLRVIGSRITWRSGGVTRSAPID